jgi:hypothetical protein
VDTSPPGMDGVLSDSSGIDRTVLRGLHQVSF